MSTVKAKKITHLVNRANPELGLSSLFAKVKQLQALQQHVMPLIDASLQHSCHVANFTANRLVMIAASGTYATQLRFQVPSLLARFKQHPQLKLFTDIQIKVRPSISPGRTGANPQRVKPLSLSTARCIEDIANTLEDEKLKAAMLKIAKHT